MTQAEFLEELRQCAGQYQWHIERGDCSPLRGQTFDDAGRHEFCPITAVYVARYRQRIAIGQWTSAAKRLVLDMATANAIVRAADNPDADSDPALRHALCVAVGLAEAAP